METVVSDHIADIDDNLSPSSTTAAEGAKNRFFKVAKIATPHLAFYLFMLFYLLIGAWIFARIEYEADYLRRAAKLESIQQVYDQIALEMSQECGANVKRPLYKSLSTLSTHMEGNAFELVPGKEPELDELLPPRWNKLSSVLFALSILTTTGYAYANPITGFGQCAAIAYGLLGIPLMILAAVDIGRFMSDIVIGVYSKISPFIQSRKPTLVQTVESKAIRVIRETTKRQKSWRNKRLRNGTTRRCGAAGDTEAIPLDPVSTPSPKPSIATMSGQPKPPEKPKKRLPLSVNASILLLFCMMGGVVYVAAFGDDKRTFIEGFFVTFNLVANLTMSEMPSDLSHIMTLVYITFFVTFGLAVLSMCADLAASELKWVFLKIHYFGRKINWKRRVSKTAEECEMEVEVKELLKIINQIRTKYPEKGAITPFDILEYMQELNGDEAVDVNQQRRDTIAFMPQSIEALKFADDMDLDDASHRSLRASHLHFLDSESTSLLPEAV